LLGEMAGLANEFQFNRKLVPGTGNLMIRRSVFDDVGLFDEPRPRDSASEEYRRNELALYERLAGRPYATDNEHSPIEVEDSVRRPHPYRTGSAEVVGDQLILLGFLMKAIGAGPPARVLELGPGWGNTTLALLQTGYVQLYVATFMSVVAALAVWLFVGWMR